MASERMPLLLVCDHLPQEAKEVLDRHRHQLRYRIVDSKKVGSLISDAHFLIARSTLQVNEEFLRKARCLKLVVFAGSGLDSIDLKACRRHGVQVMDAGEANAIAAAELTIALMLDLLRSVSRAIHAVESGEWKRKGSRALREKFRGEELFGRTVALIGYGRVGSRVAERLTAFGCELLICDPYVEPKSIKWGRSTTWQDVLKRAELISFHVPLTAETKHLLDRRAFASMKQSPLIVNTSRGSIVDDQALAMALQSNKIRGYACDVLPSEPPKRSLPWQKRTHKVLITPHIGAQTEAAQRRVGLVTVQKVVDFLLT